MLTSKETNEISSLLISPPSLLPETPPISIAVLKSYLHQNGFKKVSCFDMNLEFYYYIMNQIQISPSEFDDFTELGIKSHFLEALNNSLILDEEYKYQISNLKDATSHWSAPFVFSYHELLENLGKIEFNEKINKFINDDENNVYVSFFQFSMKEENFSSSVLNANHIGFSIIGFYQAIPAICIASYIKHINPSVHITFGGPWVTLYEEVLPDAIIRSKLDRYIDSFCYSEGEDALKFLLQYLEKKINHDSIPNIILKVGNKYVKNLNYAISDFQNVPLPDYSDFDTTKYISFIEHNGRLTVQSSRGCYHAKCSFCNALTNLSCKNYRQKDINDFLHDIDSLISDYPNVKVVDFADSVCSKKRLVAIARRFIDKYPKISWEIDIRLEQWIDEELISLMKQSKGILRFGLETTSPRLLKLVNKGNDMENVNRIIGLCKKFNYKPLLMAIIGLPSETIKEAYQLKDFLISNVDNFSILVEDFNLERNTDIYFYPDQYGIKLDRNTSDLSPHYKFYRLLGYSSDEEYNIYNNVFLEVNKIIYGNTHNRKNFNWIEYKIDLSIKGSKKICSILEYNRMNISEIDPHFKQYLFKNNIFPDSDAVILVKTIKEC